MATTGSSNIDSPAKSNQTETATAWKPYDIGIMIIDEDPTSILFVHTLLETCHFRVVSYVDPIEALNHLHKRSSEFDLVIADLHMLATPGYNLVDRIAKGIKLPVITTCVDDDPKLLHQAITCGSCFHLAKPIGINNLEFVWKKSWKKKSPSPLERPARVINLRNPTPPLIHYIDTRGKAQGQRPDDDTIRKKKERFLWPEQLHTRFLVAVSLLGLDAVPSSIIAIMNVTGLTVKQVASHLQKHRKRVAKENENNLISASTRFPTTLTRASSKRPITDTSDGNRKLNLVLPKLASTAFDNQSNQTGSTLSKPTNFAITPAEEIPTTLPRKERKIFYEPNKSALIADQSNPFVVNSIRDSMQGQIIADKETMFVEEEGWPGLDEVLGLGPYLESDQERGMMDERVAGSAMTTELTGAEEFDLNVKGTCFDDALLAEMMEVIDKGN